MNSPAQPRTTHKRLICRSCGNSSSFLTKLTLTAMVIKIIITLSQGVNPCLREQFQIASNRLCRIVSYIHRGLFVCTYMYQLVRMQRKRIIINIIDDMRAFVMPFLSVSSSLCFSKCVRSRRSSPNNEFQTIQFEMIYG